MLQTKTTIIISKPPFATIDGKEAVDLALVCAAFEQQVNLIFVEHGVLHLLADQDETAISDKLHDMQLDALEFYDIDQIYVSEECLIELNLCNANLIDNVKPITVEAINQICASSQNTVTF